jgi:hypothetical protein
MSRQIVSNLATSLIPALAVIMGGLITGIFALSAQHVARKADQVKWDREASERNRTRFHESRLHVYTEFLAQASNAMGFELQPVLQRHNELTHDKTATGSALISETLVGHSEFNPDAARPMTRRHTLVMLLAASSSVRDAATALKRFRAIG